MPSSIVVDNISKQYRIGQLGHPTMLREALMGLLRPSRLRKSKESSSIWSLRDVSFSVERGDVVGIIGRNGAGKSTLLKVISRITRPTSGRVKVHGRVGSLLEVGTGFHQELTGRENIYLNGSILGMKKREIDSRLDAIIDFSGVEKFIDTPIKRFSSGMRLRLGFAVAAHLEPEVLLVDEVLAVGDASFQRKCLQAMDDLHHGGRTVVFVSHNMAAIENLCPRTLWIEQGGIHADGPSAEVIRSYLSTVGSSQATRHDLAGVSLRSGSGDAHFTAVEFLGSDGLPAGAVCSGDATTVRLHFQVNRPIRDPQFGVELFSERGLLVTGINTWVTGCEIPQVQAGHGHIDLEIDSLNLMPGRYHLSLWVVGPSEQKYDALDHCATLEVHPADYYKSGRGIDSRFGVLFMPCRWRLDGLTPLCPEALTAEQRP